MKMKKALVVLGVAGLLLAMAVDAHATPVQVQYMGVGPKENLMVVHPFSTGTYHVGQITIELDLLDGNGPQSMTAFCVDLKQTATGSVQPYDLTVLQAAPQDGGSVYSPMGSMKANAIRQLWGAHFSEINGVAANAAAFQLAIWEIIYENAPGADPINGWTLSSGNVIAQAGAAVDIANGYLATMFDAEVTPAADLFAVTNMTGDETYQDFVVQIPGGYTPPVPEPVTVVTGFLGLCGLGSYVRRRTLA